MAEAIKVGDRIEVIHSAWTPLVGKRGVVRCIDRDCSEALIWLDKAIEAVEGSHDITWQIFPVHQEWLRVLSALDLLAEVAE